MEKTLVVAKNLYDMYRSNYRAEMDEMKMHKLMYFSQRENLLRHGEVLFDGTFYGWKYGPVLKEVRSEYRNGNLFSEVVGSVSESAKEVLEYVVEKYGALSSWKLSSLSHREFSWKSARRGLDASQNGNNPLSLTAMKVDAAREKMTRTNCE